MIATMKINLLSYVKLGQKFKRYYNDSGKKDICTYTLLKGHECISQALVNQNVNCLVLVKRKTVQLWLIKQEIFKTDGVGVGRNEFTVTLVL